MKPDITSRADIEKVVELFYKKVKKDDSIGVFFSEKVKVDWEKYLPEICAFWENVLFYTGDYKGSSLVTHKVISQKYHTTPEHFKRGLQLFNNAVDSLFEGANAKKIKDHAHGIVAVMQKKTRI